MNKCFADLGDSCVALNRRRCEGCNFYKTHTQAKNDREKALRRLKTLDKPTRMAIAEKYGVEGIV